MIYPSAYLDYLIHFHVTRDYFECHEVLEDYWKEDAAEDRKQQWVAIIQLAVACYHHRRQNIRGAITMYRRTLDKLKQEKEAITACGIDCSTLIDLVENQLVAIEDGEPFTNIDLPLADDLLQQCEKRSLQYFGEQWACNHTQIPYHLIHKHRERDRQMIIDERELQKAVRLKQRKQLQLI